MNTKKQTNKQIYECISTAIYEIINLKILKEVRKQTNQKHFTNHDLLIVDLFELKERKLCRY